MYMCDNLKNEKKGKNIIKYAMYTGFEFILISNKPNFSFIKEEMESISDFSKKKTQIFDFGICMYLKHFFFKKYHFLVNLLLFLNCKYFGLAKPLKFMLWLLSLQKI